MKRFVFPGLTALCVFLALTTSAMSQENSARLETILKTQGLWGKDFPIVLAQLEDWSRMGEKTIQIFPHHVLGAKSYMSADEAKRDLPQLARAMRLQPMTTNPSFQELVRLGRAREKPAPRVLVGDDQVFHLALVSSKAQLIDPGLTLERVHALLGKPERIDTEAIQSPSDRRPVILTLHVYADGLVSFAESDEALRGFVNRVVLNVPAAAGRVFKEAQDKQ